MGLISPVSACQSPRVLNTEEKTERRGLAGLNALLAYLVSLNTGEIFLHIIRGPQNKGDSLVNGLGLHVQNRLGARGRQAPCLLNDEGHRIALVQEPELQRKGQASCKLPKISSPAPEAGHRIPTLDFCLVSAGGSSPSSEI